MPKKLTFPEFRTAGYRNLNVCKELLQSLNNCNQSRKSHILHKIYYLSGYIIEFSFKYMFFSALRLKESDNLYDYENEAFRKNWQQHDYNKLRWLFSQKKIAISSDIPYLGNKLESKELEALLAAWDVQIRYSLGLSHRPVTLTQQLIKELVDLNEQILTKVTTRY